jgi:hypothetical protein
MSLYYIVSRNVKGIRNGRNAVANESVCSFLTDLKINIYRRKCRYSEDFSKINCTKIMNLFIYMTNV